MQWARINQWATMSGALALSACAMPIHEDAGYAPPPPPIYSGEQASDEYGAIDRADLMWKAIGDAPPDFAFPFEGNEPWAWETQDGHLIVVEDGAQGIRSYYFDAGADGPFLAVRPGMSFGFDGEAVAVVYGADGGAMPRAEGAAYLEEGVALYARGRALRRAIRQPERQTVDSEAWIDASPLIWGSFQLWDEGRSRYPGWQRHRDGWQEAQGRRRLEAERLRRRGLSEQFQRWRAGGYQGPAPGRFHRPGERPRPGAGAPTRPRQPGQWGAARPRPSAGGPARSPRAKPIGPPGSTVVPPQTWAPGVGPGRPGRPGAGRPRPEGQPAIVRPGRPDGVRPPRRQRPGSENLGGPGSTPVRPETWAPTDQPRRSQPGVDSPGAPMRPAYRERPARVEGAPRPERRGSRPAAAPAAEPRPAPPAPLATPPSEPRPVRSSPPMKRGQPIGEVPYK